MHRSLPCLGIFPGSWLVLEEVCSVPASRAAPDGMGMGLLLLLREQGRGPWGGPCGRLAAVILGTRSEFGPFPRAMQRATPSAGSRVSLGLPEHRLAQSPGPAPGDLA